MVKIFFTSIVLWWSWALLPIDAVGQFAVPQSPGIPEPTDEIREVDEELANQILRELGSQEFAIRQTAAEQLWQLGAAGRQVLIAASQHPDREVRKRAQDMIRIVDLGINRGTPPKVAKLVLLFHSSGQEVRSRVLDLLIRQNRFGLAFELIQQVDDQDQVQQLYHDTVSLNDLLMRLAREEDWESIDFILNHRLPFQFDSMVCVYYQLAQQRIPNLIRQISDALTRGEKEGGDPDDRQRLMLCSLCRIEDQYEQALRHASEIKNPSRRSAMTQQIYLEQGVWKTLSRNMVLPEDNLRPDEGKFVFSLPQQALIHSFANEKQQLQGVIGKLVERVSLLQDQQLLDESQQAKALVLEVALSVMDWQAAAPFLDIADRLDVFELLILLQKIDEAFAAIELGSTFEERSIWLQRRIRNIKSLENKIRRQEQNGEDSDAAEEDLDQTWQLCCDVVGHLGTLGFTQEALFHYRTLFAGIRSNEDSFDLRSDVILGLMHLGEYDEVWKLVERGFSETEHLNLTYDLFPYKRSDSVFWLEELSKRTPDPMDRLRLTAALINSPLALGNDVDIESELAFVRDQNQTPAELEYEISKVMSYHGRDEESARHLRIAEGLDNESARQDLAVQYLDLGEYSAAAELFEKSMKSRPSALSAILCAEAYRELGELQRAALLETIGFVHWHDSYRSNTIVTQFARIDRLHLITDFLKIYVVSPGAERVSNERYRSSLAATRMGTEPARAANDLQIMLLDLLNNPASGLRRLSFWADTPRQIAIAKATSCIADGNTEAAVEQLMTCIRFRPGDSGIGENLFRQLEAAGEREQANQLFDQLQGFYQDALVRYPLSPLHHNNYAWMCATANRNLGFAKRHSEKAVTARPFNSSYLDTLAEINFLSGETGQAIELSRRCTQLNPFKIHYRQQLQRFRKAQGPSEDQNRSVENFWP